MNKQLFYGQYKRINSYFDGTELASSGLAAGAGAADSRNRARQGARGSLHHALQNPVGGNPEAVRANLRESARLLKEAGFEITRPQAGGCRGQAGHRRDSWSRIRPPSGSCCSTSRRWSASASPTSIRIVDDAQYQNRLRSFDFDIIIDVWAQSLSPGNEQREFWGSQAADLPGSKNTIGIKNPAVDALIDKVIFAKDRADLVAATRALDRVLLWNFYVVPQFTYGFSRYARWDRFSHAEPLPKYGRSGLPSLWWYDADKAARIGKRS